MDRQTLDLYICETYNTKAEFPWESTPTNAVYRHKDNKKWFALVMDLPRAKLFGTAQDITAVMNLKCDPLLIGSLLSEKGIYPAYHMNKSHWISIITDEITDEGKIKWLLNLSFELTKNSGKSTKK